MAQNMIPRRKTIGFPHCLARVPREHRVNIPFAASEALAWADGARDLLEILHLVQYEIDRELSQSEIADLVRYFSLLDRYGYLSIPHRVELNKRDIKQVLCKVGLKKGSVVFVHSSLSALGHVKGGADTVIDALLETLGPRGTLLMTTHTADLTTVHDGVRKTKGMVEGYDPRHTRSGVGKISDTFWRREGVLRSAHPTHSVAAFGPLAEEMLCGHASTSNPCDYNSPFGKMVDYDGYFLFFGVEMTCATFFHTVEDCLNLPYLQRGKILVKDNDAEKVVTIRRIPSGHRDFYHLPNKILTGLRKAKLRLKVVKAGLGELKMVRARELYEKTSRILKKEPDVLLCDNPECTFCSKWKARTIHHHRRVSQSDS